MSISLATIAGAVRAELVNSGYTFVDRLPQLEATVPIATVEQLEKWQGYYSLLKVMVWLGPLLVVVLLGTGAWLLRDAAMSALWFAGSAFPGSDRRRSACARSTSSATSTSQTRWRPMRPGRSWPP